MRLRMAIGIKKGLFRAPDSFADPVVHRVCEVCGQFAVNLQFADPVEIVCERLSQGLKRVQRALFH